jgi:hypothetical protein
VEVMALQSNCESSGRPSEFVNCVTWNDSCRNTNEHVATNSVYETVWLEGMHAHLYGADGGTLN